MHWLALLAFLVPSQAIAGGVVVWMEGEIPADRARGRAEKLSAADTHLALPDLALPPSPPADADAQDYAHLREVVISARERWDEFEVEFGIATELASALGAIDIVRDDRDLDALIEAYAVEGAAVSRAFESAEFESGERAEPFRLHVPGISHSWNRPWLDAIAIHSEHRLAQSEAETATWPAFGKFQEETPALPDAKLDLTPLPAGFIPVVDGKKVDATAGSMVLEPGVHYLHTVRDGVFHGRAKITVAPGESVAFPVLVSPDELALAREQVLAETTTGFPDDVKRGLEELTAVSAGPVFVAALNDSGRVVILPYARGAMLIAQRPVTGVITGDLGPEIVVSPLFDERNGDNVTAPGLSGSIGFEMGIYNGAVVGGMDLAITPGHTVQYANDEETANVTTAILPQPWGGLGAYILRPIGKAPSFLVLGTLGWNGPAHMATGARATFGLPTGEERWVRLTMGASMAAKSLWDEDDAATPMRVFFVRLGFGNGV